MSTSDNSQLALFEIEQDPFPHHIYQKLVAQGPPFREIKRGLGSKGKKTIEEEYWFPFYIPDDWNRVLIVGYHPSFHEMRRMEQRPGEFVSVMLGEGYTLLAAHIFKRMGLSWDRSMLANLIPWYMAPKSRVTAAEERYGFQFIEHLIKDYQPQLIISFGASIVPHLVKHLEGATVTALQGQLIPLPQYQAQLVCATQPVNLISKVGWIKSWEQTMRAALMRWFHQSKPQPPDPPVIEIDTLADLQRHLKEIRDNREDIIALDTEFVGSNPTDLKILDIILASRSRTLNIRVREGRSEPVLRNPYDIEDTKGDVYIFPNEEEYNKWQPPNKSFRAYIDDTQWVFDAPQEEVVAVLRQHLLQPTVKIVGHALKVDIEAMLLFGVDLRDNIYLCTYDLAKVLDEGQPQGLDDLIKVYLGKEDHKLPLARYREERGITAGSYALVPPKIRRPYGALDGRRTFELVPVMLENMRQQDEELRRMEPEAWKNGWTLENAYFNKKRGQMGALIEMELLGHPMSLQRLRENIEWYDAELEKLLQKTVEYIRTRVQTSDVNPASAAQLRHILFDQPPGGIGLYPLYTTDKPVREWGHAVIETLFKATKDARLKPAKPTEEDKTQIQKLRDFIHQQYGSATLDLNDPRLREILTAEACPIRLTIPVRDYTVLTASTNQETLEMLAEKDLICEKLNDCRSIATLANNYCRKDGIWGTSRVKQFLESLDAEEEDTSQMELFGDVEVSQSTTEEISVQKGQTKRQKAISMVVNPKDSFLYTTYWGSLETHRLRTSPNVSAVPKGEVEYVTKIIGYPPPHTIRGMEMAPRGWFMFELDYAAAEVQRLAQVSGDPNMTEIMGDPERDPHASLARAKDPARFGNMTDKEIKKKYKAERDEAKPFTFGIPYQRGNEAMARSLNREAIRKKEPAKHTAESVAQIKNAYSQLYNVAWHYLEEQMSRVIPQEVGPNGRTYFTSRGVYGYQVSPGGFRRRYLDPTLVRVILAQENKKDSELLRNLKDMRREASNWQIQHGVAIYIMEACANWTLFRKRNPNVPIVLIDILHDAMRFLVHWSAWKQAHELLPRIMTEIPSNINPKLRADMQVTYEWNGPSVKEPIPHPDQPDIPIPSLKYLGLEAWNSVPI